MPHSMITIEPGATILETIQSLLQLRHDGAARPSDQKFRVRAIAEIELRLSRLIFVKRNFAIRSSGLKRRILFVNNHHILVMEMHRRRFAGFPRVAPHNHPIVLQQLLHMRPRKRIRITGFVRQRRDRMILELDHDGARARLAGRIAFMSEDRGALS